ncbi:DUF3576 domain-containing protein [Sulfitobacter sp. S190]|uniref:DUF3576 domain-containing protein n=1 Tax=Sulfitobacter sp. S190 TaxID=2867022 RepID=UPI0021A2E4F3|nr:DUF3576 domain-containing protein [Sulfitobacter sp. S190]UWR22250.1 DUF3576 domain-containing protein [Sulfitobacter sp. S190]
MTVTRKITAMIAAGALMALAACDQEKTTDAFDPLDTGGTSRERDVTEGTSIFDAFRRSNNDTEVQVNRYIWNASLQVLDFLPIQSVDPFTGVIVTGYGTPPGSGRAYRATVLINDPALDARSLNVALQARNGGAVDRATTRAVEDAILSRARQLRVADGRL